MTTAAQYHAREIAMLHELSAAVTQARAQLPAPVAKAWADAERLVWKALGAQ